MPLALIHPCASVREIERERVRERERERERERGREGGVMHESSASAAARIPRAGNDDRVRVNWLASPRQIIWKEKVSMLSGTSLTSGGLVWVRKVESSCLNVIQASGYFKSVSLHNNGIEKVGHHKATFYLIFYIYQAHVSSFYVFVLKAMMDRSHTVTKPDRLFVLMVWVNKVFLSHIELFYSECEWRVLYLKRFDEIIHFHI